VVNRQHLLFTETWRHSKFGCNLCKFRGEKHPRASVEVVEGSEIYNFPILRSVHFAFLLAYSAVQPPRWSKSSSGRRRREPRPTPPAAFSSPTKHPNRALVSSQWFPHPLPTDPGRHLVGIRQGPPVVCPRDLIASSPIFPGSFL
jgi:hypothetical protein